MIREAGKIMKNFKCRICNGIEYSETIEAKERILKKDEIFTYLKCKRCGALNLLNIPLDLSKYYPDLYRHYSMVAKARILLGAMLYKFYFSSSVNMPRNFVVNRLKNNMSIKSLACMLKLSGKKSYKGCSLLDVGSSTGEFLKKLRYMGFHKLEGVDPYIKESIIISDRLQIIKQQVANVKEKFDFVVSNHSIEHVADPVALLKQIRNIVKNNGIVLVRTPIADSWCFDNYKQNWSQLDPGRHLLVFTRKAMKIAAEEAGFVILETVCDAPESTIRKSELLKRSKSLYYGNTDIFTFQEKQKFSDMSNSLNNEGKGDTAAFYLRPI